MKYSIIFAAAAPALVAGQVGMWGQCGGIGYGGSTSCTSGAACSKLNDWYYQCLPGTQAPAPTTTTRAVVTTTRAMTTTPAVVTTTRAAVTTTVSRTTTPAVVTTSRTTTGSAPAGTGLNNLIKSKGKKYFGFIADPGTLSNTANTNIIKGESGMITPENSMKWESLEANRGTFTFGNADQTVAWAQANGQQLRGHTLVWHSQLPQWVKNISDKTTLTTVIQNHVTTIMKRYAGKIYAWDVANEIFNDDGTFRSNTDAVFYRILGKEGYKIAFRAARAADPTAKLCLNDYNLDYTGAKLTNFVAFVKEMVAEGVPIDCVGTQAHLVVGNGAIPYFKTTLEQLASTGLEVQITELDIRMKMPSTAAQVAQQTKDYQAVAKACMDVPLCAGITVWGVSDKDSWVPSVFSGEGDALLYDNNFSKKAAYQGVVNGINGL